MTGKASDAAMAPADFTVGLAEYAFAGPKLTAGDHTIRMENNGEEVHEELPLRALPRPL